MNYPFNIRSELIGLLAIFFCSIAFFTNAENHSKLKVKIEKIKSQDQYLTITLNGLISQDNFKTIATKTSGFIEGLLVKVGDTPIKDKLLMRVVDNDLKYKLAKEKINLKVNALKKEKANDRLKRNKILFKNNQISEELLRQSQLESNLAEQRFKLSKVVLEQLLNMEKNSHIYAGEIFTVVERNINEGDWVDKGAHLLKVLDHTADKYITLKFSRGTLNKIKQSSSLILTTPNKATIAINKNLLSIIPNIDLTTQLITGVIPVKFTESSYNELMPGEQLRLKLKIGVANNLLIIPVDAVSKNSDSHFVWKWVEGALPKSIGIKLIDYYGRNALIEVNSQLSVSDTLIVSGNDYLLPGTQVVLDESE